MSDVLWRRLRYMLSPQWDLYRSIAPKVYDKKVFEVGFGTGIGTVQLAQFASYLSAMEIDQHAVHFASNCFPLRNTNFFLGDIVSDGKIMNVSSADAVVMIEVLEHIKDWRVALANVARVLLPNGKLYISARNANADLRRNDLHEREWTAKQFKDALLEFFSDVKLYDYTLTNEQTVETRMTPLIAVARKENK